MVLAVYFSSDDSLRLVPRNMAARRLRGNNYGEIDVKQLQQETDEGHVSQRRKWVLPVPQVALIYFFASPRIHSCRIS